MSVINNIDIMFLTKGSLHRNKHVTGGCISLIQHYSHTMCPKKSPAFDQQYNNSYLLDFQICYVLGDKTLT